MHIGIDLVRNYILGFVKCEKKRLSSIKRRVVRAVDKKN